MFLQIIQLKKHSWIKWRNREIDENWITELIVNESGYVHTACRVIWIYKSVWESVPLEERSV